jgi:hypothetical protein
MKRARRKRRLLLALSCWLLACSARCSGCDAPVAELLEVHGRGVERDFHGKVGRWQAAEVGARFRRGDGLRAAGNAHAIVQLVDGSLVRLPPGTVLRFMAVVASDADHGLDVQKGEAEISVGAVAMPLRTPLGLTVIERGGRVVLRRTGAERMVYRVELGAAKLERERGGYELVKEGELVEVGAGMAVVDRRRTDAPAQAAAEPAQAAVAPAQAAAAPAPEPPPPVATDTAGDASSASPPRRASRSRCTPRACRSRSRSRWRGAVQ